MIRETTLGDCRFVVAAVSQIGRGKTENQDSFLLHSDERGISAVVCDGLGSEPLSKIGSMRASEITLDILNKEFDVPDVPELIRTKWLDAVGPEPHLYDTTCRFVSFGVEKIVFGGIGDGLISIHHKNGDTEIHTPYKTYSNRTDSIMSPDYHERFEIHVTEPDDVDGVLIATDGFSDDFKTEMIGQFFSEIIPGLTLDPPTVLSDLSKNMAEWPLSTNCDDKTVVIIVRHRNV